MLFRLFLNFFMKHYILFIAFWVYVEAISQSVGINSTGSLPHPSAMLDVQSTNRGLLLPRLTTAQRQAISSPAEGLMVYDTDLSQLYYYTNSWQAMTGGNGWALSGNAGISGSQFIGTTDGTPIRFRTNNLDRFTIDLNGNMVVASDQQSLRFASSTGASNVPMMMMFGGGSSNRDRMVIAHSNTSPSWGLEYRDTNDVFFMRNASTRRFAFELGTGHMGIGVENPEFPLDLAGRMRLKSTGSPTNLPGIWFSSRDNEYDRAFFGMMKPDSSLGIFSQHQDRWFIDFELMREPRIGINTRRPNGFGDPTTRAELHIKHTNFGGSNDGIRLQNEEDDEEWWNIYSSFENKGLEFYHSGQKRAVIHSQSGVYTMVSDERLKQNIQTMHTGTLQKVLQLHPATYQFAPYINDENGKIISSNRLHHGFIAQEVEKIFPELVYRGADNPAQDFLTMDYSGFGVLAIKAIQEQQQQIQRQQQEINELKAMLHQILQTEKKPLSDGRKLGDAGNH